MILVLLVKESQNFYNMTYSCRVCSVILETEQINITIKGRIENELRERAAI